MPYLRAAMVAVALTVAFIVPSTASAQINRLEVAATAQLGPEGATVTVPVIVNCDPGFTATVFVTVAQSTGGRLAQGTGGANAQCTGFDETVNVVVASSPGVFAYKQGKASATGTLSVFNPDTGESALVSTEPQQIRIRK
jgi:hypothetical protein